MTITTQRTSKPLKAFKLIANLIQILGFLFVLAGASHSSTEVMVFGFQMVGVGIALHIVARTLIWWNHD